MKKGIEEEGKETVEICKRREENGEREEREGKER